MTSPVIENAVNGVYGGSGASPGSAATGAGITTSGPNRLVVIVAFTARENTGTDYNFPTAISASGLTFTHTYHDTFTYSDSGSDPSYPVASVSVDIFTAPAPSVQSGLAWTATMSGDGFVNNGVIYQFAVSGTNPALPFDSSGTLPKAASNVSGVSSALAVSGVTTSNSSDLLLTIAFSHNLGVTPTTTASWSAVATALESAGPGDASAFYMFLQSLAQTSPATISVTAPYSAVDWYMMALAFTAGSAAVDPHSFGTVTN